MSIRPDEERKVLATMLADTLASGSAGKEQVLDLFTALGYELPANRGTVKLPETTDHAIGIYTPSLIDGEIYYRRNESFRARWDRFADIDSIPPKRTSKRIVLLGESVARGFLLDPEYTPAQLLSTLLNSNTAGEELEVIDLAETNLSLEGLEKRYRECLVLQPDMVILFAGNNWRTDIEVKLQRDPLVQEQLAREVLGKQHIAGMKGIIEEVFASMIDTFLAGLHTQAVRQQVKLLFVVPEYNLMDYRSTAGERALTRLKGNGSRQWIQAMSKAKDLISVGEMAEAAIYAARMTVLDPTHPLGYELLADCKLAQLDLPGARIDLETARDCGLYFRTNSKPRMYRVIRDTILAKAHQYQLQIVDLPLIFSHHLRNELPGRTLFFDYCHLTARGLQIAMEAVACQVLAVLYGKELSPGLPAAAIHPDNEVNARAHLLAAIHNAHWGQGYEILFYHCMRSLDYGQDMKENMMRYCDMVTRRTSNMLCASYRELLLDFRHSRHFHAFRSHVKMKGFELPLVTAMTDALKHAGIGDPSEQFDTLRLEEHGITDSPINLLSSHYHVRSYDYYQGTRPAYYQSREPVSSFQLPVAVSGPVMLTLTLRVPAQEIGNGSALVRVNGTMVQTIMVNASWSDHVIWIAADQLVQGINELTIEWPIPFSDKGPELPTSLLFISSNTMLDKLFWVAGEIIRFSAIATPSKKSYIA